MNSIVITKAKIEDTNYKHSLAENSAIKLFKIYIPHYIKYVSYFTELLNVEEYKRSQKYHFEKDSNRFIICRAILKIVLARYLNLDAKEVKVEQGYNKKPFLPNFPLTNFNLSHCNDYAIISIGRNYLGVDVEFLKRDFDFGSILNNSFNPVEKELINVASDKAEAFFKLWTRKEAIVKATGIGINDLFKEIPSMDGKHYVNPKILGKAIDLLCFSFLINYDYVVSVAVAQKKIGSTKILLTSLPKHIDEMV